MTQAPIHVPFDEHSNSNEPPLKRSRKSAERTVVEPTQVANSYAPTVERPAEEVVVVPTMSAIPSLFEISNVVLTSQQGEIVRVNVEEAKRPVQTEVDFVVVPVTPVVLPTENPSILTIDNLNPTL